MPSSLGSSARGYYANASRSGQPYVDAPGAPSDTDDSDVDSMMTTLPPDADNLPGRAHRPPLTRRPGRERHEDHERMRDERGRYRLSAGTRAGCVRAQFWKSRPIRTSIREGCCSHERSQRCTCLPLETPRRSHAISSNDVARRRACLRVIRAEGACRRRPAAVGPRQLESHHGGMRVMDRQGYRTVGTHYSTCHRAR